MNKDFSIFLYLYVFIMKNCMILQKINVVQTFENLIFDFNLVGVFFLIKLKIPSRTPFIDVIKNPWSNNDNALWFSVMLLLRHTWTFNVTYFNHYNSDEITLDIHVIIRPIMYVLSLVISRILTAEISELTALWIKKLFEN